MEISEVRVALRESQARASEGEPRGERRLKAYATLTFDHCFVVRNIKVIEGRNGLFVAMPSHKPKVVCGRCQFKNDLGGRFCSQCGTALPRGTPEGRGGESADNPAHRDIAHPITMEFRQYLQQRVLAVYEAELAKARSTQHVNETTSEALDV
jgi:stage V sporulation protein G